jgi:pimeloyl-ACP methyl ester carboxylesterase
MLPGMRWTAALALLAACGGGDDGTRVMMDPARADTFYDAPFPSDDLLVEGHPDLTGFPNPGHAVLVEQARTMAESYDGFGTSSGIFFRTTAALDPDTIDVLVEPLDGGDPAHVDVTFEEDGGPYGAPDLLAAVPVQGIPLAPGTRYAAIVTTDVHDASGAPLEPARDVPDEITALADPATVAGYTIFTTGHPTADVANAPIDPVTVTGLTLTDTFPDFCVYATTVSITDYQQGTPPYSTEGGNWGPSSHQEDAHLYVTIPRTPAPAGGYPLVVFSRTGAGGDRAVVDRGQQLVHNGPAIEPGEGPARYFARAGFAAVQVDGPLGGLRNPNGGDEQFLTFNVNNLFAMRDNVRESAVELADMMASAGDITFDASDCAGASATVAFDPSKVAIMGHSMGAWIAPLAVNAAPDAGGFGAMVLSGAGGSWIENVLYKQEPVPVLPFILVLVQEQSLRADDPVLTLAQWALEPADPQVYGRSGVTTLMEQGIVDTYILPRIANATSLRMGLDLAGDELDTEDDPRLADQQPLGDLLPLVGRGLVDLPSGGNVVVQHLEDGVENGHEIVFQLDGPKHQYQCFLQSWAAGAPSVPVDAGRDAPCP